MNLLLIKAVSLAIAIAACPQAIAQRARIADRVRDALSSGVTLDSIEYANGPHRQFCKTFLVDFVAQKNIEFLQPSITTDTYEDAALAPYKQRCPALEMNRTQECEARIADSIRHETKDKREELFRSMCRQYRGSSHFELYEVDIDNNPRNGKETLLHFEEAIGPTNRPDAKQTTINGAINIFDLRKCSRVDSIPTQDSYDQIQKKELPSYNGVLKYQGKYYVFDLHAIVAANYALNLYRLEGSNRGPRCVYATPTGKSPRR